MATLVQNTKLSGHSRSISFPTSSHPLITTVENHLNRLKSSEDASSSSSHTSTCSKLEGLRNLYNCLDDLLSNQHLSRNTNEKLDEEIMDGSLRLLEVCNTTRDVYSSMKESVQDIESSIRRKRGCDIVNEIDAYMMSKKKLNKMICKCLKEVKRSENVNSKSTSPLVVLIKEIQEISLGILESSLCLISGAKYSTTSKPSAWFMVSKMLQTKRDESDISEIQKVEVDLRLLNSKKSKCNNQTRNILKQLEGVSYDLQEVTELLEVNFRLFLKTRVSLLNILNH